MSSSAREWTFLSNHGHVLLALAQDPQARMRDVATAVGITERAVQLIVRDLEDGGLGLDEARLTALAAGAPTARVLDETLRLGASLGLGATPSFVLSPQAYEGGMTLARKRAAIAEARPLLSGVMGGQRFEVVGSPLRAAAS